MILRSRFVNVYASKVLAPLAAGLTVKLLIGGPHLLSARLFVIAAFLLFALFMLSLAVMEVRDGTIRYCRLFKWRTITKEEISEVRVEWEPFIASMRLRKYLLPWGRLYFLLDANSNTNPFGKGKYPLIKYLSKTTLSEDQSVSIPDLPTDRFLKLRSLAAAAAGFILGCLTTFLPSNSSVLHDSFHGYENVHGLNSFLRWLMDLFGNPVVAFAIFVMFMILAIFKYRRPNALIYAFCAGCAMAYPFLYLIRKLA